MIGLLLSVFENIFQKSYIIFYQLADFKLFVNSSNHLLLRFQRVHDINNSFGQLKRKSHLFIRFNTVHTSLNFFIPLISVSIFQQMNYQLFSFDLNFLLHLIFVFLDNFIHKILQQNIFIIEIWVRAQFIFIRHLSQ